MELTPSRQKDPKQRGFRGSLRAYIWGPTVSRHRCGVSAGTHETGAHSLGAYISVPTVSRQRFWISASTYWTGGLQSGGLHLGAYSLAPTILDLGQHSLDWGPTAWGLTSEGLQSLGTDFGSQDALTGLGAYSLGVYIWGPTVSGHRLCVSGRTHWTGGL